jgi:hypothetical protein
MELWMKSSSPMCSWSVVMSRATRRPEAVLCVYRYCSLNPVSRYELVDFEGFWRWCMMYRTMRFILDFIHRLVYMTKYHNVSETGSVSVLRWMGQGRPTQLGPLERASLNHCDWFFVIYTRRWIKSKINLIVLYKIWTVTNSDIGMLCETDWSFSNNSEQHLLSSP